MQKREPGSRALSQRGQKSHQMCGRAVSQTSLEVKLTGSISKMRESCLSEFDAHWQCLEKNNQVSPSLGCSSDELTSSTFKHVESLNVHSTTAFSANW